MIAASNKIFEAAIQAEPEAACKILQRSLGIEDADMAKVDLPDRHHWVRGSTSYRLHVLARWMSRLTYLLIERNDDPRELELLVVDGRLD